KPVANETTGVVIAIDLSQRHGPDDARAQGYLAAGKAADIIVGRARNVHLRYRVADSTVVAADEAAEVIGAAHIAGRHRFVNRAAIEANEAADRRLRQGIGGYVRDRIRPRNRSEILADEAAVGELMGPG